MLAMAGRLRRFAQIVFSHRACGVLTVSKMNEQRLDRSKAPHRVRGHDALHRDQCEGAPRDKISELIFFPRNPSHKPLKRSLHPILEIL
jgi:hypothetical protein